MGAKLTFFNSTTREIIFQVMLHLVLFLFYSFDRNEPQIHTYKIVTFLTYALVTLIINYMLLPLFFYKKKYLWFFLNVAFLVALIIAIEELVIEKIYFPDTRGKYFPGIIYNLLDVMPVITILTGFKFAWDAATKQREVEELKMNVKESELQFLKSQINPHFLFNNLNNLYSHAIEESPKTPGIILELSGVLRYMLYDCREDFVALSKEIEHLKNFTKLNELQIEERGAVTFVSKNVDKGYRIAPLILTVFIENAFKHSTASQSKDIFIDIFIAVTDGGALHFTCSNTYQPATNTESLAKGIGLQNVKKRLQLLYPNAHDLVIGEDGRRYSVDLKIQLKPDMS
jgi:sensor histidine kinase YesM